MTNTYCIHLIYLKTDWLLQGKQGILYIMSPVSMISQVIFLLSVLSWMELTDRFKKKKKKKKVVYLPTLMPSRHESHVENFNLTPTHTYDTNFSHLVEDVCYYSLTDTLSKNKCKLKAMWETKSPWFLSWDDHFWKSWHSQDKNLTPLSEEKLAGIS